MTADHETKTVWKIRRRLARAGETRTVTKQDGVWFAPLPDGIAAHSDLDFVLQCWDRKLRGDK